MSFYHLFQSLKTWLYWEKPESNHKLQLHWWLWCTPWKHAHLRKRFSRPPESSNTLTWCTEFMFDSLEGPQTHYTSFNPEPSDSNKKNETISSRSGIGGWSHNRKLAHAKNIFARPYMILSPALVWIWSSWTLKPSLREGTFWNYDVTYFYLEHSSCVKKRMSWLW